MDTNRGTSFWLDLPFKLIENGNLNGKRSKEDNQQARWLTSNWRIRILNDEVKESAARFSSSTDSCSSFKRSRLINTKPGYLSPFPRHGIRISNFQFSIHHSPDCNANLAFDREWIEFNNRPVNNIPSDLEMTRVELDIASKKVSEKGAVSRIESNLINNYYSINCFEK